MNADDRAHWLDPSPPLAVDGEEPPARPRRPTLLPPERAADVTADDPTRDLDEVPGG